jgi:hypothetical protein
MYTLQGKPNQHATRIPRSVHVCSQAMRISRGQRIATFHVVVNRFEQIHCSREEGLPTQPTIHRLTSPRGNTQLHSQNSQEAVGKSQSSIDNRLIGLPSPYHRHVIGTFNTCLWGSTHRSLTDTSGGYNYLRAPPGLRLSNLNIASIVSDVKHLSPTRGLLTTRRLPKCNIPCFGNPNPSH